MQLHRGASSRASLRLARVAGMVAAVALVLAGCSSAQKDPRDEAVQDDSIAEQWKLLPSMGVDPGPLAEIKHGWSVSSKMRWNLCWNQDKGMYIVNPAEVSAERARGSLVFHETVGTIAEAVMAASALKIAIDGIGDDITVTNTNSNDVNLVTPPTPR